MPKKVLIVDDSQEVLTAFHRALSGRIEVILCASTIAEAKRIFKDHPDIVGVILDGDLEGSGTLNTLPLLVFLKRKLPRAIIVAASGDTAHNDYLLQKGCNAAPVSKDGASQTLLNLLFPSPQTHTHD